MAYQPLRVQRTTDGRLPMPDPDEGLSYPDASGLYQPDAEFEGMALDHILPKPAYDRSAIEQQLDELEQLGPFRILGLLGKGSMGKVFLAEDQAGHRVALKVCPSKEVAGKRTYRLEQFLREGRSMARVAHEHVVQTYEMGEDRGFHYIAMELLEGDDLSLMVKNRGPFRYDRACQLIFEAAGALDMMHILGVIHRDIKPSNLMLCREGRCKIVDFGLAMETNDGFELPGKAVGSTHYIAPEVTQGQDASHASDVYSLAGTLFFLITGRPPFTGKTQREVIRKHNDEKAPDVRTINPNVPAGLAQVIARGLAKNPADRYEDATQFAKALEPFLVHVPEGVAKREAQAKARGKVHVETSVVKAFLENVKQEVKSRLHG